MGLENEHFRLERLKREGKDVGDYRRQLEGELFDFETLKAPLADFESGDNSIIFDWRRVSKLQFLNVQEENHTRTFNPIMSGYGVDRMRP